VKTKICISCNQEFLANANNQKLCSVECRTEFGRLKEKERYAESFASSRKESVCIVCKNKFEYHFRRERGERKFCSRSCASKYHIQNGAFENWRIRRDEKRGKQLKCINPGCKNLVYVPPRLTKAGKGKLCSFECEKLYFSQLFKGDKNPFYGKKLTHESKVKQKETLQSQHPGITNAFSLAKKRTKTKPQIELFEYVSKKYPSLKFEIEKRLNEGIKEFYGDIVSFTHKIVIEFNGDYWHCNPTKYDSNFFHHVKKVRACDIWHQDAKRLETISSFGYRILVIWESDHKDGTWTIKLDRWLEEYAKENNINVIRPSVNNYSSADVKLGELLENRGEDTTT
jgi:G:T-mismatch repair DNA endonuclease (very short patch repair protein)